jgi:acetyl esterase/lipase
MKAKSPTFLILIFLGLIISLQGCTSSQIMATKDLTYLEADSLLILPEKKLNIFAPKDAQNLPVLIFIHGGSWNSGDKKTYSLMAKKLARRSIVTVVINYPLAPDFQIQTMELAALRAVIWTKNHIAAFGGDPDQLFISGHSAGGHLAGLLATKEDSYHQFKQENPLKGALLIDPAGLDMHWFLQETNKTGDGDQYLDAFTADEKVWKEASPIYFLEGENLPILILEGEKTYPGIRLTIERFRKEAEKLGVPITYELYPNKKHIPMITQFFWGNKRAFQDVVNFIEEHK